MLRAVRFAAQLDFALDSAALEAIAGCAPLCSALSPERVAAELRAVLASRDPDMVWLMADLGLLNAWLTPREGERTHLSALPRCARLAHFCSDLSRVRKYYVNRDLPALPAHGLAQRENLLRCGGDPRLRLARLQAAAARLRRGRRPGRLPQKPPSEGGFCAPASAGRSLPLPSPAASWPSLGYAGRELGEVLRRLLEHVIDCPEDNRPEILCKLALERIEGYDRA